MIFSPVLNTITVALCLIGAVALPISKPILPPLPAEMHLRNASTIDSARVERASSVSKTLPGYVLRRYCRSYNGVQLDEIVINSKCPGTQFTSKVCDEAYVPAEEPLWSDGLIRPENAKGLFSPPFTATAPRTGTVPAGPDTVHYHTEYHYHAAKSRSGDASEAKDD